MLLLPHRSGFLVGIVTTLLASQISIVITIHRSKPQSKRRYDEGMPAMPQCSERNGAAPKRCGSVSRIRPSCPALACRARALLVAFCIDAATAALAQARNRPPQGLLLYPYDNMPGASAIAGDAARKRLMERLKGKVEFHVDFLHLLRFPAEAHRERVARHLAEKYS